MKISILPFLAALLTLVHSARAQDIAATVAPNKNGSANFVDLQNNSGNRWYFYSSPSPSGASMSRISGLSEYPWPSAGNFAPDTSSYSQDRIFQGEYLRVYPNALAAGTVISIPYASSPLGTQYHFYVTVTSGAQVTSLHIIDASPTSAATVHWRVTFDQAISGVTAANFAFNNPDSITGLAITSVTADTTQPSTSWTITASTGTGTGILGLNWTGHQTESPTVPNSFVGDYYDFSVYPIISQYPASVGINVGSTATLSVVASLRGGGTPNYQWYSGTSVTPASATAISGATGSSYTPPVFNSVGSHQYFCRVYTIPATYTDSTTATITVVTPPQITTQPVNAIVATGQTATFQVQATGTSLNYNWYQGTAPDTSTPMGGGSSFTTPALSTNTSYWVQVSNPGPTLANSSTVKATVVSSLTPSAPGYGTTVTLPFPVVFAVTMKDSANNVMVNLPVTFTAPGSGASGHFPGNATSVTVNTDAGGVATAPVFTANGTGGSYNVVANYSTLAVNLPATNYVPFINSTGSVTFLTDLTNTFTVTETGYGTPSFSATGTLPAGVALSPAGVLSGLPPSGSGGVYVLNVQASNGPAPGAAEPIFLTVVEKNALAAKPTFFTNGLGWALDGDTVNGGPNIIGNVFVPTDGNGGETRAAWFRYRLYVGAFKASYTYQDVGGNGADGTAFVLQNDARGTGALGVGGGGLGYLGISPSVGLMMNIYSGGVGGPSGILLGTNGVGTINTNSLLSGLSYASTAPVNLDGGNPINVSLVYTNGVLNVQMLDTVTRNAFQTNLVVDIPGMVGTNIAWVGMVGAEGGVLSYQTVSNFKYVPLPTLAVSPTGTNTVVLSWPASIIGYSLQAKTNVNDAAWNMPPPAVSQAGGQNQAVVPAGTGAGFYELILP
jgi:Ig-like domain CHU_C associated/Bacterial lectin